MWVSSLAFFKPPAENRALMNDVEEEKKKASICLRGLCGSWKMLDGLPSMARQRTSLHQSVASNQGARVIVLLLVTPHTTSEGSTQFPIPGEEEEIGGEEESCNGGGEGH